MTPNEMSPTVPATMRAVRVHRYGGPEVLQVDDVPTPLPGPTEVLVRVRATSVNPGEMAIREGVFAETFPMDFPFGEGSDLAGDVAAHGADVTSFAVGDAVFGWTDGRAAHAEYVAVAATHLAPIPAGVTMEQAGSLYVVGATAVAAVDAVALGPDDTVVVSGAAGGVGVLVTQLAVQTGATVIALAGAANHDWLRSVGAIAVGYDGDRRGRLRDVAPGGIDAWIDLFGDGYVDLALELGVTAERINTIIDFAAAAEHGVSTAGNGEGASIANLVGLADQVAAGTLQLPIASSFPLDEVRAAYDTLAARHTHGKIVLLP